MKVKKIVCENKIRLAEKPQIWAKFILLTKHFLRAIYFFTFANWIFHSNFKV